MLTYTCKLILTNLDIPVSVTGEKTFTGTVTLELDDTDIGTFNDVDLDATYNTRAFIDEDNSFSSEDTFSPGKKRNSNLVLGSPATHQTLLKTFGGFE